MSARPMMVERPRQDAVTILQLHDQSLLTEMQDIVERFIPSVASAYTAMDLQDYRVLVAWAQDALNAARFVHRLAFDLRTELCELLHSKDVAVQSNLYLRAARPAGATAQESVGWHRESFYGGPPDAMNFWMPVRNVTPENSIRYVPGSETIPEDQIVTVSEEDPTVQRQSAGHKIGLLYAPKRIVSGVDFATARPMVAGAGHAAVFPGSLIHGAAINRTDRIRFSVDFRVLPGHQVAASKKDHYASGQEYFVPLVDVA